MEIYQTLPLSLSILRGIRFEVVRTLENSFVNFPPLFFLKGIEHVYTKKLSIITNIHPNPLLFETLYSIMSTKSTLQISLMCFYTILLVGLCSLGCVL